MSIMLKNGRFWQLGLIGCVVVSAAIACCTTDAIAQITPDQTLGAESSVITPNVNIKGSPGDRIDGGATRGTNLFHSFSEFNVGDGGRVYFANPAGIQNILTRVTGTNASNILGTLGVDGNANLFLINPNGIIFCENARLDIPGSFFATTTQSLVFADGSKFSAVNPEALPLLTINVTPGLQYGNSPGTIANAGNLSAGQNLTLAAGNLNLSGQLIAGKDLTLQATDTLRVRDSSEVPFIASAGGKMEVQGNAVDILVLNHPKSGFYSGGDMIFRSADTVGGDAHYSTGGNFRIEKLDGSLGNLSSPYDPIILAGGDVSIGNYTGASLHILAGGSVQLGDVTINGLGSTSTSINSANNATILGTSTTYSALSFIQPSFSIDGSTQPTLDVRAGIDWSFIGTPSISVPTAYPAASVTFTTPTSSPGRADITVSSISVTQPNGLVYLSNQYHPNTALNGEIKTGNINTDISTNLLINIIFGKINAGNIYIYSRDNIIVEEIDSRGKSLDTFGINPLFIAQLGDLGSLTKSGNVILKSGNNINVDAIRTGNPDGYGIANNINLDAVGNITVKEALTSGSLTSNAGNITVNAGRDIIAQSRAESGLRNGGNIKYNSGGNITLYSTTSQGGQSGGDINLSAQDTIFVIGGRVNSGNNTGFGSSGNITTSSQHLKVLEGGGISTATRGSGVGGNLKISAPQSIELSGTSVDNQPSSLNAFTLGSGRGGNLELNTQQLTIKDGGSIFASTFDRGNGGDITINAPNILLQGTTPNQVVPSGISVDTYGSGNAGNLIVNTQKLTAKDGASISASTIFGTGNSGNITVNVSKSVNLDGTSTNGQIHSGIYAQSFGTGKAGSISVNTSELAIANGAKITVSSDSQSEDVGGLLSRANNVIDNANISSNNFNTNIIAVNNILSAIGINLSTITNFPKNAVLSSNSQDAGSINVNADNISMKNQAQITAISSSGEGGNINLQVRDLILMRYNSLISATAGTAKNGGNGGNININTQFVVAVPQENSDITANAFLGNGGNINITAYGIYGLKYRPNLTPRSDITASSQFGVNGTVNINILGIDPTRGINILSSRTLPAPIEQRCQGKTSKNGNFYITGKGGLSLNSRENVEYNSGWNDLPTNSAASNVAIASPKTANYPPNQIVEAQGWEINAQGQVVLTASVSNPIPTTSWFIPSSCESPAKKVE